MILRLQICSTCLLLLALATSSCKKTEQAGIEKPVLPISIPEVNIDKHELVPHSNEGKMYYEEKPFSGYAVSYYENSQMAEKTGYWKGKKHGARKKWFSNGLLSYESQFISNRQEGISKSWWKNGVLRSKSHFTKGIAHGLQQSWYQSGKPFKAISLNLGKEEGMQRAWRENGKLYVNYEAKDGRIFGLKRTKMCFQLDDEKITVSD